MLKALSEYQTIQALAIDSYDWFMNRYHGHMGKWQYMEPLYKDDPVRGAELWDVWEQEASKGDNMLQRQGQIIADQIRDIVDLTKPCNTLIDLGPGGLNAVAKNTSPFIKGFGKDLKTFVAIDMADGAAKNAQKCIQNINPDLICYAIHDDFLDQNLDIPYTGNVVALMMGGTIGNFEAHPNEPYAVDLMAKRIRNLKSCLPANTTILIGLEATQNPDLLYGDYDNADHAAYEINLMHGIKRDVLPDEEGFDPYAWKYSMKWWPEAHQFCHIAEATELQRFELLGQDIRFTKGTQLVIDNSFKFPVLAMQRAAQLAGTKYLKPFSDEDGRMVIHAIQL